MALDASQHESKVSETFAGFAPSGSTLCPKCDYDLTSLPAAHQCPECGLAYDGRTRVWEIMVSRRLRLFTYGSFAFGGVLNLAFVIIGLINGSPIWIVNSLAVILMAIVFLLNYSRGMPQQFFAVTAEGLYVGTRKRGIKIKRFLPWHKASLSAHEPSEWRRKYWLVRVGRWFYIHLPSLTPEREEQLELLRCISAAKAHYSEEEIAQGKNSDGST